MPRDTGYKTLEDAAEAALQYVGSLEGSDDTEYIGLIYEDPKTGKFKFTEPKGGEDDDTRGAFRVPRGSARGIFHNHPIDDTGRDARSAGYFSPDDVAVALKTGLKSFISAGNATLAFDPSGDVTRGDRERGVRGTPVLARIPVEDISARMKRRRAESDLFAGTMQ